MTRHRMSRSELTHGRDVIAAMTPNSGFLPMSNPAFISAAIAGWATALDEIENLYSEIRDLAESNFEYKNEILKQRSVIAELQTLVQLARHT